MLQCVLENVTDLEMGSHLRQLIDNDPGDAENSTGCTGQVSPTLSVPGVGKLESTFEIKYISIRGSIHKK